jgi:YihY family inner membrane protein
VTLRIMRAVRAFVDLWSRCFAKHDLLTWASAIAFQALVALVPLTLLSLGILGALDERSVWQKQIHPGLQANLPKPTLGAIDYAADKILMHATAGLLAFGAVLTIWEISGSVRAVGGALNRIYDTKDERPIWVRFGISFGIAVVIGSCLIGAVLLLTLAKHTGGSLQALLGVGRWIAAVLLLGVAVNVLIRFAPFEHRSEGWVSLGTAFIVAAWVVASLIFRWYVGSVASFRSAWGTFVAVLVLTGYLYTSAIVFLVGVQADELIRKDSTPGEKGMFKRVRAALG